VGDMQESTFYCVYRSIPTRQSLIFADDSQPRWLTCVTNVDYETVACGDKFGNVFINRLDTRVSENVDDDPTGAGILHEKGFLMGAAHKTDLLAHYNVGSVVTSLVQLVLPLPREKLTRRIDCRRSHWLKEDGMCWCIQQYQELLVL
jgi:splicing factor 3B subunit 3